MMFGLELGFGASDTSNGAGFHPQALTQGKQIWSDLAGFPHRGSTCPAQSAMFGLAEMLPSAQGWLL